MKEENTAIVLADEDLESAAEEAVQLEVAAKLEPDRDGYTHRFRRPFQYQGAAYEQLHFDWNTLTGSDYLSIETEMLMRRKTLVTPEISGDFLCGIAVRACTDRQENGFRVLTADAMKAMPIRDFITICKKAQAFLMRAGS